MRYEMQLGLEEWLPQRAALLTAIGMWAGGFALAGASAWRIQHPTAGTNAMNENTSAVATQGNCDNASTDAPADTAESEGAVFMPGDMVVGRRTPRTGVTAMQKP
jgi:hypothetical protein